MSASPPRVLLIAGRVRHDDRVGHHDYLAGCRLLAELLSRRGQAEAVVVEGGWPRDDAALRDAAAIVIYDGGGGKQGFLRDEGRIAAMEAAAARGCGLVMLHQCVGFPRERADLGLRLLGGVYVPGISNRGHWKTKHDDFPVHPVTRGVAPWSLEDGWLTGLVFADTTSGLVPLVRAGEQASGREDGNVAAWAWERPGGGRSFGYTGIDGHAAWNHEGLRRLVTNGVLWSAGVEIAPRGADVDVDAATLSGLLTPRASSRERFVAVARKGLGRLFGGAKRW